MSKSIERTGIMTAAATKRGAVVRTRATYERSLTTHISKRTGSER